MGAAAGALLGTGKDELVTRSSHSPWDIVDAEGKPLAPEGQPAVIALKTGKPVKGVLLGVARPSAPRVWLIVSAIPIGEGASRRAVVNFTDATAETGLNVHNTRFSFCAAWEDFDNDGMPDAMDTDVDGWHKSNPLYSFLASSKQQMLTPALPILP